MKINNTFDTLTASNADLLTIADGIINKCGLNLNCLRVGILEEFYANTQTAKVVIAEKKVKYYKNDGVPELRDYAPIIAKVCFCTPYGTYPLQKGEECLLIFNDREIETWHTTGQANYNRHNRMHDFTDCFAIFGIRSIPKLITILTDCVHYFYKNSAIKLFENSITIDSGSLTINPPTTINNTLTADTLVAKDGATGTITDSNGKQLATVKDGIITAIL